MPLAELPLAVTMLDARVEGTVQWSGGKIVALEDAVLGGAISKAAFLAAIDALPDDIFYDVGVSKGTAISIVNAMVTPDIDSDGDGIKDAASFGIRHHASKITFAGWTTAP